MATAAPGSTEHTWTWRYCNEALAPRACPRAPGSSWSCPDGACGIVETLRVVRWMANESARQCGPCAFGLPAIAEDLNHLAHPTRDPMSAYKRLEERLGEIDGHGACRHPDGVVRFVRSALTTFAEDFSHHASGSACGGIARHGALRERARTSSARRNWYGSETSRGTLHPPGQSHLV